MKSYLATLAVGVLLGFGIAQLVKTADPEPAPTAADTAVDNLSGLSGRQAASPSGARGSGGKMDDESLHEFNMDAVATAGEFDAYLEKYSYSKESLLAVIRLDREDKRHLLEAAKRYPDDPHIQFLVITRDVLPDEKSKWIERFKKSQPDNAYASLLAGEHLLEQGESAAALEQLRLAASQQTMEDFSSESWLAADAAMLELGYDPFEAKMKSTFGAMQPFFGDFQSMLRSLQEVAEASDDPAEQIEIATIGAAVGNQFTQGQGGSTILHRLVGISAEYRFIGMLEPGVTSPGFSDPPEILLAQLDREREEIIEIAEASARMQEEFDQNELEHYLERVRLHGEMEAIRWARERLGVEAVE